MSDYAAIRYATSADVDGCQKIARQHSKILSFVRRDSLLRAVEHGHLFVADIARQVVGFVHWNAPSRGPNKGFSKVYDLATAKGHEGQGVGRALLYAVPCPIRLSCPIDAPSNAFYRGAGMGLAGTEKAKSGRVLNVYEMRILSIIVRGDKDDVPSICRATGNAYGTHHHDKPHGWPFMVDSDPEKCDWLAVMAVVNEYHPVQVLTADYFPGQRETMLAQVQDLRDAGVLRIAVCPKFHGAVADIPPDCIVAVSLQTNGKLAKGKNKYAGFMPDLAELAGRRVHLLGGSPRLQKDMLVKLQAIGAKVLSVDGSAHFGTAGKGSQWSDGKWRRKNGEPVNAYRSQIISSTEIRRELNAAAAWSQPSLFRTVQP